MLSCCRNHNRKNNYEYHTCQNNTERKLPFPRGLLQLLQRFLYCHSASSQNAWNRRKRLTPVESYHFNSSTQLSALLRQSKPPKGSQQPQIKTSQKFVSNLQMSTHLCTLKISVAPKHQAISTRLS